MAEVRYRMRPVAAFRSTKSNSSEPEGPGPSGVPFIAVHDLTSQTLERLHENWKNVEQFIKNLQARQQGENESLRSSSVQSERPAQDNVRRPPFTSSSSNNNNNVYTFRYHPIVLDDAPRAPRLENLGAGPPTRNLNGPHYNPGSPSNVDTESDLERHTIATVYTVGICLTIMAIGSVMFILINKCDGSSGTNYIRTNATTTPGSNGASHVTRSMLGAAVAARSGRQNNGRGRSSRRGRDNGGGGASSVSIPVSGDVSENDAKVLTDLPPSYASLFPEGEPKAEQARAATTILTTVINDPSTSGAPTNNTQSQNANLPTAV